MISIDDLALICVSMIPHCESSLAKWAWRDVQWRERERGREKVKRKPEADREPGNASNDNDEV